MADAPAVTRVRRPVRAPRLTIVLDGPDRTAGASWVAAPDRLLRIWELLNAASNELHQVSLTPDETERLERQLQVIIAELEGSVSPELARELRRLLPRSSTTPPGAGELRIELTSLIGWLGGLVIGMLSQLEVARAAAARRRRASERAGPAVQPGPATAGREPSQAAHSQPGAG